MFADGERMLILLTLPNGVSASRSTSRNDRHPIACTTVDSLAVHATVWSATSSTAKAPARWCCH